MARRNSEAIRRAYKIEEVLNRGKVEKLVDPRKHDGADQKRLRGVVLHNCY